MVSAKAKKTSKKQCHKWIINCKKPMADEILDLDAFVNYLKERVKVKGKAGALGDVVSINGDSSACRIDITSKISFSKRYFKYLTKKFLKKNQLRDYIRVIADSKNSYELRYFNIHEDGNESS
eukprot:215529_1